MSLKMTVPTLEEFRSAKVYTMEEICKIIVSVQYQEKMGIDGITSEIIQEKINKTKEKLLLMLYGEHLVKEAEKAMNPMPVENGKNN